MQTTPRIAELRSRSEFAEILPTDGEGCEIGVREGDHAETLWRFAKPRRLLLADLWRTHPHDPHAWTRHHERVKDRFRAPIAFGDVKMLEGDHRETLAAIPAGSLDWTYVDAWHEYAFTRAALADAIRLTKVGGIVAAHDFRALPAATWRTGAMRPILEALNDGLGHVVAITNTDWPEIAIRKVRDIPFAAE